MSVIDVNTPNYQGGWGSAPRALQPRVPRLARLTAARGPGMEAGPPCGRRGVRSRGRGAQQGATSDSTSLDLWENQINQEDQNNIAKMRFMGSQRVRHD